MKIGIISDIHANITAFNAVIEECEKLGVEKYIFCGDVLAKGPSPKECLNKLQGLDTLAIVMGNCDDCFSIFNDKPFFEHPKYILTYITALFENKFLSKNDYDYITSWRKTEYVDVEGLKIKVMHALNDNYQFNDILASSDQQFFEQMLCDDESNLAIYGHVHNQILRRTRDGRAIINPGSVGLFTSNRDKISGIAQFAVLDVKNGIFDLCFKSAQYDIEEEIQLANERNMPYKELYTRLLKTGEHAYNVDKIQQIDCKYKYKDIILKHQELGENKYE